MRDSSGTIAVCIGAIVVVFFILRCTVILDEHLDTLDARLDALIERVEAEHQHTREAIDEALGPPPLDDEIRMELIPSPGKPVIRNVQEGGPWPREDENRR